MDWEVFPILHMEQSAKARCEARECFLIHILNHTAHGWILCHMVGSCVSWLRPKTKKCIGDNLCAIEIGIFLLTFRRRQHKRNWFIHNRECWEFMQKIEFKLVYCSSVENSAMEAIKWNMTVHFTAWWKTFRGVIGASFSFMVAKP